MRIVWSDDAISDYHQNIDYLLNKWSAAVALEFIEDVDIVIGLIKSHPELYPLTDYQDIRKAVIRKQISLLFKVTDDVIYLIRFWNSYQNPETLNI